MGVLTADQKYYGFDDVKYYGVDYDIPREAQRLETWIDYDPATGKYTTRIGKKPEATTHADDLPEWERELLYGDVSGCQCGLCRTRNRSNGGPTVVNTKCNDCGKLETKLVRLTDELTEAKAKRDEYDTEATHLAKELERVMAARDELLEVLSWYEQTE